MPQYGTVLKEAYKYYYAQIYDASNVDLSITVTPTSGLINLFVGTTRYPDGARDSYQWSAQWFTSTKTVRVAMNDPKRCNASTCTYYVGVYGVTDASYSLVISSTHATVPLQNGIPQRESIDAQGMEEWI